MAARDGFKIVLNTMKLNDQSYENYMHEYLLIQESLNQNFEKPKKRDISKSNFQKFEDISKNRQISEISSNFVRSQIHDNLLLGKRGSDSMESVDVNQSDE